jgi:transcriptional regulator with XRE-family HTH domain
MIEEDEVKPLEADNRDKAHQIDCLVGSQVKQSRTRLGVSSVDLARYLNVSFQQIQKYESGANRISAGKLYLISDYLHTPVENLFEGAGKYIMGSSEAYGRPVMIEDAETAEMLKLFYQIKDQDLRNNLKDLLFQLVKS